MWRLCALCLVLGAGCDGVFGLPRLPEAPACPAPDLPPTGDYDHDGTLNRDDLCPLVANADSHDEDGDGVPDACDPCPQLVTSGVDADCDGIGAACDPDDTTPSTMEFFGFGSASTISLDFGASIANDEVHLSFAGDVYALATSSVKRPGAGLYETAFTLTGFDSGIFADVGLRFYDGPAANRR